MRQVNRAVCDWNRCAFLLPFCVTALLFGTGAVFAQEAPKRPSEGAAVPQQMHDRHVEVAFHELSCLMPTDGENEDDEVYMYVLGDTPGGQFTD